MIDTYQKIFDAMGLKQLYVLKQALAGTNPVLGPWHFARGMWQRKAIVGPWEAQVVKSPNGSGLYGASVFPKVRLGLVSLFETQQEGQDFANLRLGELIQEARAYLGVQKMEEE